MTWETKYGFYFEYNPNSGYWWEGEIDVKKMVAIIDIDIIDIKYVNIK